MNEPRIIDLSGSQEHMNSCIRLCDDIIHFYTKRRRPFMVGGLICLVLAVVAALWISGGFIYQMSYGVALFGTAIVLSYAGYSECAQQNKPYVEAKAKLMIMKNSK